MYKRKSVAVKEKEIKKEDEEVEGEDQEMGLYYANKLKQAKIIKNDTKSMFEDFIGKYNQKQEIEDINKQNKLKKQNKRQEQKEDKVLNEKDKKKVITN